MGYGTYDEAPARASWMALRHGPLTEPENLVADVFYFHNYSLGPVGPPTDSASVAYGTKVRHIPHTGLQAHDPIQSAAALQDTEDAITDTQCS
jgi:hypothetical protein